MERDEFQAHLSENKALSARYEFEKRFRGFVNGVATSAESAESLPDSLRASILSSLDEIDAEAMSGETPEFENTKESPLNITQESRRLTPRYAMAMAASFALMIVGVYATVSFFKHETAFGSFEGAHYIARDLGESFGDPDGATDATSFITQNFGVDLTGDIEGLSLCGGEVLKLDNSEFAHFKFCDENNDPVSLFVGSAADYTLPAMPSTIVAGKEYFNHVCHGCELMYWRSGEALIVAASAPDHLTSRPISALVRGPDDISATEDSAQVDNGPVE